MTHILNKNIFLNLVLSLCTLGCTGSLYSAAQKPETQEKSQTATQAAPQTPSQSPAQPTTPASSQQATGADTIAALKAMQENAFSALTDLKKQFQKKALDTATALLKDTAAPEASDSQDGQKTQENGNGSNNAQNNNSQTNNPKPKKNGFKQFFKAHKKRWQNATLQGVKAFIKNTSIVKATNESLKTFLRSWKDANPEQQQEFFTELLTALDQEIKDGPVRDAINEIKNVAWYAKYRKQLVGAAFAGGVVAGFCIRSVIWRKKV